MIEAWYLNTFRTLHNSRQSGAGINPISMSDYRAYFSMFLCIDELTYAIEILQALDTRYINYINDKRSTS